MDKIVRFPTRTSQTPNENLEEFYTLIGKIFSNIKSAEVNWERFASDFQVFSYHLPTLSYVDSMEMVEKLEENIENYFKNISSIKGLIENFKEVSNE